jgi:hypothetical protein
MNNEFQKLIKQAETSFKFVSESDSLETVKERYASFELIRSQLIAWINSNLAYDDALYNEYMDRLGKAEYNYFEKYNGIPVFDDSFSEGGIENIFEEHCAYFQRYGCLSVEQILSWDKRNILIEDEIGTIEMVIRPDILLS